MELVPIRFMVKMDNKRINQKQINILDELDHDNDGMMQLLYCFKAVCIRYNIQKLDDHLINNIAEYVGFKTYCYEATRCQSKDRKNKTIISLFY